MDGPIAEDQVLIGGLVGCAKSTVNNGCSELASRVAKREAVGGWGS